MIQRFKVPSPSLHWQTKNDETEIKKCQLQLLPLSIINGPTAASVTLSKETSFCVTDALWNSKYFFLFAICNIRNDDEIMFVIFKKKNVFFVRIGVLIVIVDQRYDSNRLGLLKIEWFNDSLLILMMTVFCAVKGSNICSAKLRRDAQNKLLNRSCFRRLFPPYFPSILVKTLRKKWI